MTKIWLVKWVEFDLMGEDCPEVIVCTNEAYARSLLADMQAKEKGAEINYYLQEATLPETLYAPTEYKVVDKNLKDIKGLCESINAGVQVLLRGDS